MTLLLRLGWLLLAAYLVWSFGLQSALAGLLDPFSRNLIEQALLSAIFLCLAFSINATVEVLFYALVCFVLSNVAENLSVITGFRFGFFEHSAATGPRLFNIPWLATPTYMAMGFISWTVAQVLMGRMTRRSWARQPVGTALVAAFVFSMWDFSNDAVFHTVNGAFWYREAGAFFGVPSSNFLGWLLSTFLIFVAFGLFLARRAGQHGHKRTRARRLATRHRRLHGRGAGVDLPQCHGHRQDGDDEGGGGMVQRHGLPVHDAGNGLHHGLRGAARRIVAWAEHAGIGGGTVFLFR